MNDGTYATAVKEHQAGNLEAAKTLYFASLKTNPHNTDVLHLLGILFAQQQDFLSAQYYLDQALQFNPQSPTFLNSMGNILKNLQRYEDAMLQYQKALLLQPNNPTLHNNIGNIFSLLGQLTSAKECYSKAIHLNPQYADAHYNLSLVLTKLNQQQEATKHLEIALQLQPDHERAQEHLARLLQCEGKLEQAIYHYRLALKNNPHNILANHHLGAILTEQGNYAEATTHFKAVLELQPEHPESLYNLGIILLRQKNPKSALPYFLQLTKQKQDHNVYYNLGVIYMDLRRLTEAIFYFNSVLKIKPDDFATYINLGSIYIHQQNFIAAEKHYKHAQLLQPNNQEIAYILAALQQKNYPSQAPAEYIEHLFDNYAPYFENHLQLLEYQVPQLLFTAVNNIVQTKKLGNSLRILDLGCGTGMSGMPFKHLAQELIGIDLAKNMLQKANQKNIYTDLHHISIEQAITEYSAIDIIIAAESFVYFGDLTNIFTNCYHALKPGGIFAYTLEHTKKYPYTLQRSARFAHAKKYITKVAQHNNFTILHINKIILRKQHDNTVYGNIFVLQK